MDLIEYINENIIEWEPVKRKQYSLFARRLPAGHMFANKLEQVDTYNKIVETYGVGIIPIEVASDEIKTMPHYETDGSCITLCGTAYELWTMAFDKFIKRYEFDPHSDLQYWTQVERIVDNSTPEFGFQLDKSVVATYTTLWGDTLTINDPRSQGHNAGDIIVAPEINGQVQLQDISSINNDVFSRTFDTSDNSFFLSKEKNFVLTAHEVVARYCVTYEQLLEHSYSDVNITKMFLKKGIADNSEKNNWLARNIPKSMNKLGDLYQYIKDNL